MTDRINGVTVILSEDMRLDDAQPLLDAIRRFRGVQQVVPRVVTDAGITEIRLRTELWTQLSELLRDFLMEK